MSDLLDGQPGRPRLLLVEDDAAVRRSLQMLLESQGYDVRAYRSGQGLHEDPEALRASCLIADLVISDGDGLTVLQQLRGAGWDGKAILISGHLTDEWAGRARAQGFDAVLAKPIPDHVLTRWVARLAPPAGAPPTGGGAPTAARAKGHSLSLRRLGGS